MWGHRLPGLSPQPPLSGSLVLLMPPGHLWLCLQGNLFLPDRRAGSQASLRWAQASCLLLLGPSRSESHGFLELGLGEGRTPHSRSWVGWEEVQGARTLTLTSRPLWEVGFSMLPSVRANSAQGQMGTGSLGETHPFKTRERKSKFSFPEVPQRLVLGVSPCSQKPPGTPPRGAGPWC